MTTKLCMALFSLFLCGISVIQAQNTSIDSLLQTANNLQGEQKLERLFEIVIWQKGQTPEKWRAINELEHEARKQESDAYVAKAMWLKLVQHSLDTTRALPLDSLYLMGDECIQAYNKANLMYGRTNVEDVLLNYLMERYEYDLALHRTLSFYKEAKNELEEANASYHLGNLYTYFNKHQEATKLLQQCVQLCEKNRSIDWRFSMLEYKALSALNHIYFNIEKNYEASLKTINQAIALLHTNRDSPSKRNDLFLLNTHLYQTKLALKLTDSANILKLLTEQEIPSDFSAGQTALNGAFANYYMQTGKWSKALDATNQALSYYVNKMPMHDYLSFAKQKATILDSLQLHRQSSLLKTEIIAKSDSLNNSQISNKLKQLEAILQIERLEAEKKQHQVKMQQVYIIIGTTIIVCMLLVLLVVIQKRNLKQLRQKNKKLFEQHRHAHNLQLKGYPTSEAETNETTPEKRSSRDIYTKTVEYLLNTQEYVKSELNREELALQVGTNRQYLIEAIQENAKMTYGEFIISLRLEHARKLLLENSELIIEKVFLYSGFSNKSTFYKHFNRKYGMSPAEFRRLVNEEGAQI